MEKFESPFQTLIRNSYFNIESGGYMVYNKYVRDGIRTERDAGTDKTKEWLRESELWEKEREQTHKAGVPISGSAQLFLHCFCIAVSVLFTVGRFSVRRLPIISGFQKERQNGRSVSQSFSWGCLLRFWGMLWRRIYISLRCLPRFVFRQVWPEPGSLFITAVPIRAVCWHCSAFMSAMAS